MYNPRDILTEEGLLQYQTHIQNIRNGLFFILNHANDLHIGAYDKNIDLLWKVKHLFDSKFLLEGDGQKD